MTSSVATRRLAAFTLIELLTVITIILILAGLILGIAGNAQNKAARSRADGEIHALSVACNNYQIDNGTYPRTASNTDKLKANSQSSSTVDPITPGYQNASQDLYRFLCGAYTYTVDASGGGTWTIWQASPGNTIPKPTVYYPFKDSQLNNQNNVTSGYIDPTAVKFIQDPFGLSYGYSTVYQAELESNSSPTAAGNGTATAPTDGYNPTYDLWSTAGYSQSGGKPYPTTGTANSAANWNTLWIKNW